MKRAATIARPDWPERLDAVGFTFYDKEQPYWREDACYVFDATEIDELERVTGELHRLCLVAVEHVIAHDRFAALQIPDGCRPAIRASWERGDPTLYGRFDLRYDGGDPPVLLEYNADTPTSLIEASVAQWHWLAETHAADDQFNSIHEKLIAQWRTIRGRSSGVLHLTGLPDSEEDNQTVTYLQDTAIQAGWETRRLPVGSIGWDVDGGIFCDWDGRPIRTLFKLYPWEWLAADPFGPLLLAAPITIIEPAWKMILSNKGLLAVLWELFEGHPNLLPAYFAPEPLAGRYVRKPLRSREGANIEIVMPERTVATAGPYADASVYQQCALLPAFDGWHPVIGSWIIGDEPAGIGIRESQSLITDDQSYFVPHYFGGV
jgi:glutathionylspermidine synthase